MQNLLGRVFTFSAICGVRISFDAIITPSIMMGWQPFYNATTEGVTQEIYASISSIEFSESGKETPAGMVYEQTVSFKFPSQDEWRATRLETLRKAKVIFIDFNDNKTIVIGRNDYFQNAKPVVSISTNDYFSQISFTAQSMFPIGNVPNPNQYGLPSLIPVSL